MVRPKSNNSNASKKRLAPRIKHGKTFITNAKHKVTDKNDRAMPREIPMPELNVEKNQIMPLIKTQIETKGTPNRIRKKPA